MKRKEELISREEIIEKNLSGLRMPMMVDFVMSVLKFKKLNKFYSNIAEDGDAIDYLDTAMENLNVTCDLSEDELANIPKTGPFILISNHPFGLLDGILMLQIIGRVRPDIKVLANFLLERIEPIKHLFISVNPFEKNASMIGIRNSLKHIQEGSPLGIFPAGEVSTLNNGEISDKVWETSSIKLIQKAKVPVIPMYFHGTNSIVFHLLGKINPKLRTVALASEFLKKKDEVIPIRIGRPISVKELETFQNTERLGRFLRTKVYALGAPIKDDKLKERDNQKPLEMLKFFTSKLIPVSKPEPIIDPISPQVIEQELKGLSPVVSRLNFEVYIAKAHKIPNIMNEIGRLREVTFRSVGEGTNRKMDIDEYDLYYEHLFIWDKEAKHLVGAYRLGRGDEIMQRYGQRGFYVSSLFDIDEGLAPIMGQSVEMGRSFVVEAYQQKPFSLFLLWQGILMFLVQNKQFRYLFGPVSISNNFSQFSQDLMIAFIKKYHFNYDLAKYVRAKTPFEVKYQEDTEFILEQYKDNLNEIDKFIAEIEPKSYRIPVLLKKYMSQNAKIICFNVDPEFNNSLDGLIVMDLQELPQDTIDLLNRD